MGSSVLPVDRVTFEEAVMLLGSWMEVVSNKELLAGCVVIEVVDFSEDGSRWVVVASRDADTVWTFVNAEEATSNLKVVLMGFKTDSVNFKISSTCSSSVTRGFGFVAK